MVETRYPDGRERGGLNTAGERKEGPRGQRQDMNSPHKSAEGWPQRTANSLAKSYKKNPAKVFCLFYNFLEGFFLFF